MHTRASCAFYCCRASDRYSSEYECAEYLYKNSQHTLKRPCVHSGRRRGAASRGGGNCGEVFSVVYVSGYHMRGHLTHTNPSSFLPLLGEEETTHEARPIATGGSCVANEVKNYRFLY